MRPAPPLTPGAGPAGRASSAAQARGDLGGRRTQPCVLLQALEHELVEGRGHLDAHPRRRHRRVAGDAVKHGQRRRRVKRVLARQQLVEQDAEREDVAGGRDRFTARLFGRQIAERAQHQSGARLGADGGIAGMLAHRDACQAEVEHLHVAVGAHHHVVGLDVAMDDLLRVCHGQRLGHLAREVARLVDGGALANHLAQRAALHQLHDDEAARGGLARLVNGDDVGVVQGRDGQRLTDKTVDGLRFLVQPRRHQFHGDVAPQPLVVGQIHLAHAAAADERPHEIVAEACARRNRHRGSSEYTDRRELADDSSGKQTFTRSLPFVLRPSSLVLHLFMVSHSCS